VPALQRARRRLRCGRRPGLCWSTAAIGKLLSAERGVRIAGTAAVTGGEPALTYSYLFHCALTIAGGTSEESRNVITERILGLPRETTPR
jgi:alkylation response protein AidB-like acyl-CoA dehydrogenase